MTEEDIVSLFQSNDFREQQFLFGKILVNSTQLLKNMKLFNKQDLEKLIIGYKVPTFNHDYIARRKNMLEYYFLGKPLTINELKWIA
jgi:hypothetical protein